MTGDVLSETIMSRMARVEQSVLVSAMMIRWNVSGLVLIF
jgi:hypothetical protein